jgi:hypothetical protein
MNNQEKLATFGTQDTWRTQTKTKHNTEKRWAQRTPLKTALNPDTREKWVVSTSYTVTNIDKSCKNLLGDRGKKEIYVEGKQSIVIWDRDMC